MIKPKNPEVGMWKINGGRRQAPKIKPTVSMLLEKYTSHRAGNVFNRLGGVKRPRSPSGPDGHGRWRKNSYDQQPYFPMEPAYWGFAPPMYPHFPPWGFNPWMPYPTGPACYFQPEWTPPRSTYREPLHEKRARFNQEARSYDAITVQENRTQVQGADGKNYKGSRKLAWVPVKTASKVSCAVANHPAANSDELDGDHVRQCGQRAADVGSGVQTETRAWLGSEGG